MGVEVVELESALGEVAQALKAMAQAPRNNGERTREERTEGAAVVDFIERKVGVPDARLLVNCVMKS